MKMADFVLQVEQIENEVFKYRSNESTWKCLKTQDKVKILYKPSPHFDGNMYLFTTKLNAPHGVVYEVLKPSITTEERLKWDKSLKYYSHVEKLREDIGITYLTTPSALLGAVSPREFVSLYMIKTFAQDDSNEEFGEVHWLFSRSVEHPSRPKSKEYVRGINFPGGYAVAENKKDPTSCFLEFYVNSDVGGMLPRSLVEMALPAQLISFIKNIEDEALRRCS